MKHIGGQLLYYGDTLSEAARFWKDAGADIVMLKPHKYEDFFDAKYEVSDKFKREIAKIKRMGLQVFIHIEQWHEDGIMIEPTDPAQHGLLSRILISLAELISEYDLWPEICLGGPAISYPPYRFSSGNEIGEKEGLSNAAKFFSELAPEMRKRGVALSLENMPDPELCFRTDGTGCKKLCYDPEHYKALFGNNDDVFGICLDVGHLKLSRGTVSEYRESPFKITSFHLHSNGGKRDEHKYPDTEMLRRDMGDILARSPGPFILELKNRETGEEIEKAIAELKVICKING